MSDESRLERVRMIRELRHRLESLRRAGLDRIPVPVIPVHAPRVASLVRVPEAPAPRPVAPASEVVKPVAEPVRPAAAPLRPGPAPVSGKPLPAASLFGESGFESPPVPTAERPAQLAALAAEVTVCQRCPHLAATRTQAVFGTGAPTARLMFVGEAPGADEDRLGEPFVGRAGQLLTDMITKGMGLMRQEVYIANVLKSRPPGNRDPQPDEIANCLPYLERQIEIIRPEFLCLLGRIAAQTLLETALPMGRLRSKWHRYRGIPAIATYHPSYLLRNPAAKKEAWEDLRMLMQAMGLKVPTRKKG